MAISAEQINNDLGVARQVIEQIKGEIIYHQLLEVASIGGAPVDQTDTLPFRFATNRIALTREDRRAREEVLKPWMQFAGMETYDHPLALIGKYEGTDPHLSPVLVISHTDTVPQGDIYDGVYGVLGGIETVRAMHTIDVRPRRTIMVMALTGEESSGYGSPLFGSRSVFHGSTERELNSKIPGGISIKEALGIEDSEIVKNPIFGPNGTLFPTPHAVVELHVEQDKKLEEAGIDLGVVEAIASPVRHHIVIGNESSKVNTTTYPTSRYLQLKVEGKADHSGATPMGIENRADGLVDTAYFLLPILEQQMQAEKYPISVGGIFIEGQAINKIPGITRTLLGVTGGRKKVEDLIGQLHQKVQDANNNPFLSPRYSPKPFSLEEINTQEGIQFFKLKKIISRQIAALSLITAVNRIATSNAHENVVGTVGTYTTTPEGKIILGLDVRGIKKPSRDQVVWDIINEGRLWQGVGINFGERLPGSGDPVTLDPDLVQTAKETILELGIGSVQIMHSGAGHDIQNAARANIRTAMIFCQSNNGGISHNPNAHTNLANLEKGVKAEAALVLKLAS